MTKLIFILALFTSSFSLFAQENSNNSIDWPENYEPNKSKFYVENEIEINASPEVVWTILIDALKWESWYEGAKNVSFTSPN